MKKLITTLKLKEESGASVILVTIMIFLLVGFVAFAIDIAYTYVARNQVQNAADAGALAGARFLLNADDTINGPGANQIAYNAAIANTSTGNPVTVTWNTGTNGPEVQRGHWTFSAPYPECSTLPDNPIPNDPKVPFCPNATLTQTNLFAPGLDHNLNFINAVQVITHNTQIPSFFGRIFGWTNYQRDAKAVAYLGFAGNFQPGDFDQPFAICSRSIGDTNNNGIIDDPDPGAENEPGEETLTCNTGRMLNSSGNQQTSNTAGWTNFTQPCGTANPPSVTPFICGGTSSPSVGSGSIGTTGGVDQVILTAMRNCWLSQTSLDQLDAVGNPGTDGIPDRPWEMTLPVILCTGNNVANCSEIVGAVNLSVVWISEKGTGQLTVPPTMYRPSDETTWVAPGPDDATSWTSFASYFNLLNQDGSAAPLAKKSIYFMPACNWTDPVGTSGGTFFGVMAQIPVLVD